MLRYRIDGGNLPVVTCYPEAGQTLCAESGAMSWMSPNVRMETKAGGFKKALGRMFSGESLFLNEYTPYGGGGEIAFSSCFPGSILPFELRTGAGLIIQKTGFLAMEKGIDLSIYFQKRFGKGLFGGEGFIMQHATGEGLLFLEIDGFCKEIELGVGESILVSTGHLAAMTDSCMMDIEMIQGAKNIFLGGEGLFHTRVTGPGRVYLQSMPIADMAARLSAYMPSTNSSDSGINIRLGGD